MTRAPSQSTTTRTPHNQNAIDVPAAEEKVYCIGSVNWVKETRMALPWSTKTALLGVQQNKPQKIGAAVEEIDSSIAAFLHSPFAQDPGQMI